VGVPVIIHPEARAILERHYSTRGGLTEARLRMARTPEGASLIPNRYTGAPGIRYDNIFIMAGVPAITAGMLDALSGQLEGGAPLLSETIGCWVGESDVADLLRETESVFGTCQIGSYPFWTEGRAGANFVIRSIDAEDLAACTRALVTGLEGLGHPAIAGGI
jgi:molybdopterin-biosynthesis enzyme MoeA-like protein